MENPTSFFRQAGKVIWQWKDTLLLIIIFLAYSLRLNKMVFTLLLAGIGAYFLFNAQANSLKDKWIKWAPLVWLLPWAVWGGLAKPDLGQVENMWFKWASWPLVILISSGIILYIRILMILIIAGQYEVKTLPRRQLHFLYMLFMGWMSWGLALWQVAVLNGQSASMFLVFYHFKHILIGITLIFLVYYYFKTPALSISEEKEYWRELVNMIFVLIITILILQ